MAQRDLAEPAASLWRSPIPAVTAALLAGQLLAGLCGGLSRRALLAGALVAALGLLRRRLRFPAVLALALLAGLAQVGAVVSPPADPAHVVALAPGVARLRARVVAPPVRREHTTRLLLEVEAVEEGGIWNPARGRVQLSLATVRKKWRLGTVLEAWLKLRRPRNFGNPGEFDYEGYLARRGVYVTSFSYDDGALDVVGERRSPGRWLQAARRRIEDSFARHTQSPAREILGALILGRKEAIPSRLRRSFTAAGVAHLLAISGLHVGMVAAAGFLLCWWGLTRSRWLLLRTSVPKLAAAASLLPVLFYGALAQGSVATTRAVLMVTVFVAAVLLDRQQDVLVALAAAALLISLVWPGSILDVSFQLSFASVVVLVLGMKRSWSWWRRFEERHLLSLRGRLWRWLGAALGYALVSVWAFLGTAPLTALHFNQVSLAGLVANPVVVPLLGSVAVGFGLLAGAAALMWEPLVAWPLAVAERAVRAGVWLTQRFARMPHAAVRVVTPSPLELVLLYAIVLALAGLVRPWRRRVVIAAMALLVADVVVAAALRYHRDALSVTFLSVGQGDCTVVQFPGSEVMVVDGGGLFSFDVGEHVVAPYLWRQRIARLDYVVLTHPQRDHYGGLSFLAREFRPREFWHNGASADSDGYRALLDAVARSGARSVRVTAGRTRWIGGCRVQVMGPPRGPPAANPNDGSVVLRITCGRASVMLPGDLEATGERHLLSYGPSLRSTVLKVGHHGSRTSSSAAFLDLVAPQIAVLSLGYANSFGFPHREVLDAYRRRGVELWRTDIDGAVRLRAPPEGDFEVRPTRRSVARKAVDSPGERVYGPKEGRVSSSLLSFLGHGETS